jgi:hypothetical protein
MTRELNGLEYLNEQVEILKKKVTFNTCDIEEILNRLERLENDIERIKDDLYNLSYSGRRY